MKNEEYGRCEECSQFNTSDNWCQFCNAKHFQQDFPNWTSGNYEIDLLIQKYQSESNNLNEVLEWIPYEQFTNIEYLAKGGFSEIYKARWFKGRIDRWDSKNNTWKRREIYPDWIVILKDLNNSQSIEADFLLEITYHKLFSSNQIVKCYGISQDPVTKNYLIVFNYMKDGSLREYLKNNYDKLSFKRKISKLQTIAKGLNSIHEQGLIHRDFHSGNILVQNIGDNILCYIADLGLCRPAADEEDKKDVYGVLPYVAPEVLRGGKYTQASDVYSFGIVTYEVLSGLAPYYELAHDELLGLKICQGLRPNINGLKIPQLLKDLISNCWDADPSNRPASAELHKTLSSWYWEIGNKNDTDFYRQIKDVAKYSKPLSKIPNYGFHHQAIYTSRLLSFKDLPRPQNSQEINKQFYSQSLLIDLTKLNIQENQEKNLVQEAEVQVPPK